VRIYYLQTARQGIFPLFSPCGFQTQTMFSKPALSVGRQCEQEHDQGAAVKSLHFASPLTAHGRCASQRYNEAHMFWHTNGKHFFFFFPFFFFFFRGFFYFSGSATLNTRLLQALGEKGKVHWFSHTAGKRKVGALRVQRHLVPQHCWVSWPCHCLLWAAGDYVIISGFTGKKKIIIIILKSHLFLLEKK